MLRGVWSCSSVFFLVAGDRCVVVLGCSLLLAMGSFGSGRSANCPSTSGGVGVSEDWGVDSSISCAEDPTNSSPIFLGSTKVPHCPPGEIHRRKHRVMKNSAHAPELRTMSKTQQRKEFTEAFIEQLEATGRVFLPPEEVGRLINTFEIVGGGSRCILLSVNEKVVALVQGPNTWVAEHLVVRGVHEPPPQG